MADKKGKIDRWMGALKAVAEILAQSREPGEAVAVALDEIAKVNGVDCCWLQVVDEENNRLIPGGQRGFTPEMIGQMKSLELSPGVIGEVVQSKKPVYLADIAAAPGFKLTSFVNAGLHSFLAYPVMPEQTVVAVLGVCSRRKGEFSPELADWFTSIYNMYVLAGQRNILLKEARREKEELTLVNKLSRLITSRPDIREVYEGFVEELGRYMDVDWAAIVSLKGDRVRFTSLFSRVGVACQEGEPVPLKGTGAEWVIKHKKPLVEADLSRERKFWTAEHPLKQGLRSVVHLPLMAKNRVFAVLTIASCRPNAYGERELSLLKLVAAQIALPVENARLYQLQSELAEALEREAEEKARFINILAHELRIPLTPALSSAKMLAAELSQRGTEIDIRLAKNIVSSAVTLGGRLNELLDFARGEMNLLKAEPRPVDISELIEDTALQCQAMFLDKKLQLDLEIKCPLPRVLADEARTSQVLLNLLSNASNFSPEGTKVVLGAKKKGGELVIQVKDNGPGITLEERRKLFRPYQHAKAGGPGFPGLGLALCRQLVELQGGRIWARSEPGKGSTFSFSLPLAGER
jgi:signal transduction histidine kinase/putative methionine-R-sulfoxide reductase with GAF domain